MKTIGLASLVLVACGFASQPSADVEVTKDTAYTFYRSFKRLTSHPKYVAPRTAFLCMGPSQAILDQEKKETGPHYHTLIHIFASAAAAEAVAQKPERFPAGSIFVKEKLTAKGEIAAVAGMIKREEGFDPKYNDWEYFYADKAATEAKLDGPVAFTKGKLRHCADCHADARKTDYVFGGWKGSRP